VLSSFESWSTGSKWLPPFLLKYTTPFVATKILLLLEMKTQKIGLLNSNNSVGVEEKLSARWSTCGRSSVAPKIVPSTLSVMTNHLVGHSTTEKLHKRSVVANSATLRGYSEQQRQKGVGLNSTSLERIRKI